MNKLGILKSIVLASSLLTLAGCTQGATLEGAEVDEAEVRTLSLPERGASSTEYRARNVTLRLFGVQGVSTEEVSATLADTQTWATRNYRIGEVVGRNLRVAGITEEGITLESSGTKRKILVGQDLQLRVIEHDYDRVLTYKGAHEYTVQPRTLTRIHKAYGVGATLVPVALGPEGQDGALQLQSVRPGGVFSRLGFQEGDRLHMLDGQPLGAADADKVPALLLERLTSSATSSVILVVGRGHSMWEARYVVVHP